MSLAEVEKQALALNEKERARLAVSLLETLSLEIELSDEEVLQRDADLDNGRSEEISHEEFVRRVEQTRRR
ncbi:MAG: addiction module antitoxin RelB [Verrucomicrobia bacterium]|nr:addiction module antitoxin RelB [Verrucomicrobiota bacterium]